MVASPVRQAEPSTNERILLCPIFHPWPACRTKMKPVAVALCILFFVFPSLIAGQNVYELLGRTPDCAVGGPRLLSRRISG